MKTIIIFNTRSGNTELLATKMKETLEKYNHECEIFRDKKIKKKIKTQIAFIKEYDLIFLGSPVHAGGPAFSFRKVIKSAAKLDLADKKFMFFGTSSTAKGWKKMCTKVQKKMTNTNYIGNIGCIKQKNKEALENFDNIIKNMK